MKKSSILGWVVGVTLSILLLATCAAPNFIKAREKAGPYNNYYPQQSGRDLASSSGAVLPPSTGGNAIPNGQAYDLTFFENYGVNPFIATEDEDTSTFGMDVDTASYTIARAYIQQGTLPDKDSVRTEEFVNYFRQEYPNPERGRVFSIITEGAESRFGGPNYHLLRIGIKARDFNLNERPPANMIFVVDCSGSMSLDNRLGQVKRTLMTLAENLKPGDRIGLVIYGSRGDVLSDLTSNHDAILRAIARLTPSGSTNAAEGLGLAYGMARANFEGGKINRIILCSDGVANVGTTGADEILRQVKADALNGITLTTIGFGMDNYNDILMEKLANHGDGCYYYVDSDEESRRLFDDGASQLLMVLASDAKIQVEFNPETVDRFRLLGYENRMLNEEDFKDDTVDAGEVGAGQTVTALYEVRIRDNALESSRDKVATVRVRFLNLLTGEIETENQQVNVRDMTREFDSASDSFQFTAAVAEFAEILRQSYWAQDGSLSDVLNVAENVASRQEEEEFVDLVRQAIRLQDT